MAFDHLINQGKPITRDLIEGTPGVRVQQALTIERRLRSLEMAIAQISQSVELTDTDGPPAAGVFDPDPPPPVGATPTAGTNALFAQGNHVHLGVTTIEATPTGSLAAGPLQFDGDVSQLSSVFTFGNGRSHAVSWSDEADAVNVPASPTWTQLFPWCLIGTDELSFTPADGVIVARFSLVAGASSVFDVRVENATDNETIATLTGVSTAGGFVVPYIGTSSMANWPATGVKDIQVEVTLTSGSTTNQITLTSLHLMCKAA